MFNLCLNIHYWFGIVKFIKKELPLSYNYMLVYILSKLVILPYTE
jgi:hypothetical protein